MSKKILVVAMPNSIHTVRWIQQIRIKEWKIYLFSSIPDERLHPEMPKDGFIFMGTLLSFLSSQLHRTHLDWLGKGISWLGRHYENRFKKYRSNQLEKLIKSLKPDIIHSLEFQTSGYLVLDIKTRNRIPFPPWIATNWGSDLYLFGQLEEHRNRVCSVLQHANFYQSECKRDVILAQKLGFNGKILPVQPNTGGFDLKTLQSIRSEILPSDRKLIMLKGYQNWAGRALYGIQALERCSDMLVGYTIAIYSASYDVRIAAELFSKKTGITIRLLPLNLTHSDMLNLHAQARVSIGLSISDGISTSLLEAMVMGSFPIQSYTACADEWITHSITGMIIPPDEPDQIANAIRLALSDDTLVDHASDINWKTALARLDQDLLQKKAVSMYSELL